MPTERTVVITGISSFIGHHLALGFKAKGYTVLGTRSSDRPDPVDSIQAKRIKKLQANDIPLVTLNLNEPDTIAPFVAQHQPVFWIQHAGWAQNYGSFDYDLAKGLSSFVLPLDPLYKALASQGCSGIIITGSSAEYSDSDQLAQESDTCQPATPYGLAKLTQTRYAQQLARQTGLPTRIARVFIPYGPDDAPGKVIPAACHALRHGQPIALSPCTQARDFVYIDDLTAGYEALLKDFSHPETFDIFNLCSGQGIPVQEFLLQLAQQSGGDPSLLQFGAIALRPGETPFSAGSNLKAVTRLHWHPKPLAQGISALLKAEGHQPIGSPR